MNTGGISKNPQRLLEHNMESVPVEQQPSSHSTLLCCGVTVEHGPDMRHSHDTGGIVASPVKSRVSTLFRHTGDYGRSSPI